MKLKRFLSVFLLIFCFSSMLTNSFIYADNYQYDDTQHWQIDSKGKIIGNKVSHNFNESGLCKDCGYLKPTTENQFGVHGDINTSDNKAEIVINGVEGIGDYKVNTIISANQTTGEMSKVLDKYRGLISALSGGGALTMLLFFIINFGKLGASAGNPQQRQSALMGLLFTGIATALLGSIMIFFQFFYHALG